MNIYLYNTLTKQKELFSPITPEHVSLYSCGPTVYNKPTIGNHRANIFSDIIRRTFEYNGYSVKQIINITDVGHLTDDGDDGEDKMELRALKESKSAQEIAAFYTDLFYKDIARLNIKTEGTLFPKATEHIPEQISMIKALEKKGFVYVTSDGVYFDTSKKEDYGKLGNIDIAGLQDGIRVEHNDEKKNPTDFALWKFSPKDSQRQQEWDSPWGVGFPGWHLECSAMSQKYLGDHFDIHTGGVDHIGTHHNNEIAQSEGVTGSKHVNYWMHENHILIDGKKMSKSLGNAWTLDDLLDKGISEMSYRYWILTADYKTLVNLTETTLQGAQTAYTRLRNVVSAFPDDGTVSEHYKKEFTAFINDDVNTAQVIAHIHVLLRDDAVSDADTKATIADIDNVLGLNITTPLASNDVNETDIPAEIMDLLNERKVARAEKRFADADIARDAIIAAGYTITDGPDGPTLSK